MNEPDNTQNTDQFMHEALQVFGQYYQPANSIDQATDFLSTNEIFEALQELNPGVTLDKSKIYDLLKEEGFNCSVEPGKFKFSFKWMLIKKL